jgi:hypothetical protein
MISFLLLVVACTTQEPLIRASRTFSPRGGEKAEVAILQQDEFDAPAATAVAEAKKAAGDRDESVAHEHAVYACPMHPEVTSDQPGKCPKCGMTLVKKKEK